MAQPFRLNYKAMGVFLAGKEMQKMVGDRGELVKAAAEAIAPDYEPLGEGYKYQFGVKVEVKPTGETPVPRAVATVFNTSEHAIDVEFGNGPTPRHRTLGKALGTAQ